jgi:hypothetical protein
MSSKGGTPPSQPTYPQQNQLYAAANQDQPVIYCTGTQQIASYWLGAALDQRTQAVPGQGKKGK